MSSTRNSKNLLVSTFRPTYVYDTCGFRASVVMSNIATVDADVVRAGTLAIGDAGGNIYVGSNSGVVYATNPTNFNNVALGVGAAAGISGVSNSVFIGSNAGYLLSNANDTTIIGTNDTVLGTRNVVIGNRDFVYGNNNIIIGSDLSTNESFKLNIANLIIGDIGNDVCGAALIFNSDVRINGVFTSELFDASGVSTTNIAIPGYIRNDPTFGIIMDISEGNFRFSGSSYSRVSDVSFYRGRVDASAGIRGTGFDLSSGLTLTGNISNSGTHTANNFIGTASASNSIGGVTLSNTNISNAGTTTSSNFISTASASNSIGGITLSNHRLTVANGVLLNPSIRFTSDTSTGLYLDSVGSLDVVAAGTRVATFTATTNSIGGVTLSNTNISYAGTITGTTTNTSNRIGGVTLSNGNLSLPNGTITVQNGFPPNPSIRFGSDTSTGIYLHDIGGLDVMAAGTRVATFTTGSLRLSNSSRFVSDVATSNSIGGVTLSNTILTAPIIRNLLTGATIDMSSGNISYSGSITGTTDGSSNRIGGVILSNTNIVYAGAISNTNATSSNSIGGVTLTNSNVSNVGTLTTTNIIVSGYLRNALIPTQFDINGGNISNSGTHTANNFIGNPGASNSIGGVTLFDNTISYSGTITGTMDSTSNKIGGVTLSNANITYAGVISNSTAGSSNSIGGVTLTNSNVRTGAGTVAAPSYSFLGDVSMGLFDPATNVLGIATAGVERMRVTELGRVGIGATNPQFLLDVSSGTTGQGIFVTAPQARITIKDPNTSYGIEMYQNSNSQGLFTTNTNPIYFYQSNTQRMTISGGFVGIGTVAPRNSLHIEQGGIIANAVGYLSANASVAMLVEGSSNAGMYLLKGNNNNFIGFAFNTTVNTATAERMRIDANTGNIGIRTTAPQTTLDVSGRTRILMDGSSSLTSFGLNNNADTLILQHSGSYSNVADLGKSASILFANATSNYPQARIVSEMQSVTPNTYAANLIFQTNGSGAFLAERMRIDSNGYVGIGVANSGTTPLSLLHLRDTCDVSFTNVTLTMQTGWRKRGQSNIIAFCGTDGVVSTGTLSSIAGVDSATGTDPLRGDLVFSTAPSFSANTERMRIKWDGKIGIGTASPAYLLDISGSASAGKVSLQVKNTAPSIGSQAIIRLVGGNQLDASGLEIFHTGDKCGLYNPPGINLIEFWTGGANRMVISNGNVGIGTSNPTFILQLAADSAAKPTTNTWTISSDSRIKQNIEVADVSKCYSIVKNLKLKRFTWDASYMPNVPDRNSVGWIAQDVSFVFPNAVTRVSNAWFHDFHSLDVDQIYKTMYGALEKVIADKEVLETRIATLESQLSNVLTRLSAGGL